MPASQCVIQSEPLKTTKFVSFTSKQASQFAEISIHLYTFISMDCFVFIVVVGTSIRMTNWKPNADPLVRSLVAHHIESTIFFFIFFIWNVPNNLMVFSKLLLNPYILTWIYEQFKKFMFFFLVHSFMQFATVLKYIINGCWTTRATHTSKRQLRNTKIDRNGIKSIKRFLFYFSFVWVLNQSRAARNGFYFVWLGYYSIYAPKLTPLNEATIQQQNTSM